MQNKKVVNQIKKIMNISIGPIKNKETWRAVVRKAQAMGYKWHAGEDGLMDDYWNEFEKNTFIVLGEIDYIRDSSENDIMCASKSRAEYIDFPIITPDEYLFGVKPGDRFVYNGEEVEYIGYDLGITGMKVVVKRTNYPEWDDYVEVDYEKCMTNTPKDNTEVDWTNWQYLEPVEEEKSNEVFIDADIPQFNIDNERLEITRKMLDNVHKHIVLPPDMTAELHSKAHKNYYKDLFPSVEQNKAEDKTMLQELTNTLKKHLSPKIRKQYRASLRDGDLELTERGYKELVEILAEKFEDDLTERAEEIIKEHEEE